MNNEFKQTLCDHEEQGAKHEHAHNEVSYDRQGHVHVHRHKVVDKVKEKNKMIKT